MRKKGDWYTAAQTRVSMSEGDVTIISDATAATKRCCQYSSSELGEAREMETRVACRISSTFNQFSVIIAFKKGIQLHTPNGFIFIPNSPGQLF
jgi:heme-binding NEAT domain protein